MKFLRWIEATLSLRGRKGEAKSTNDVYQIIHEAHARLLSQDYENARALLLPAIGSRERLKDPAAINYILMALEATWLFTEQYEDGIAFFSQYISGYTEDSAAYQGRAANLWYAGRLREAIRDYSRALELRPREIWTLSGRGQVLAELGENGRAMEDLDLALQTLKTVSMPDSSWAEWYEEAKAFVHNGRGFALAGLGDQELAMDEFERSIKLSPENAWVYHNRAQVYDRTGSGEKASADYQRALEKKKPALNPIRKRHAQARVRELSKNS
jgi:tetratricopeptide (TPR) repeat protein